MTTKERLEAIDRLRRLRRGEDQDVVYRADEKPAFDSTSLRNIDRAIVVDAYLAEHPDDDDMPIDEAWLRSLGFTERGKFGLQLLIRSSDEHIDFAAIYAIEFSDYKNLPCPLVIWNDFEDNTSSEGAGLPMQPETRGQLRRLLAALGVEI